jgi:hypothetical protein
VRYTKGAIEMRKISKKREMEKMGKKIPLHLPHLLYLPRECS